MLVLLVHAADLIGALAIASVEEVLRPRATTQLREAPPYVLGLSSIRGVSTPVVDLGLLLTGSPSLDPQRWVSLVLEEGRRRVALAVDSVEGVVELDPLALQELPPLLDSAGALVRSLGTQDAELLAVLESGGIVPAALWQRLEEGA